MEGVSPVKKFNHLIYQDCVHFPSPSLNGNQYASIIIDAYSGTVSTMPIPTTSSEHTAQHLLAWVAAYGSPFSVQTDNGPEFSGAYRETLLRLSILDRDGIAYRPQQQGKVERFNREVKLHVDLHLRHFGLPPLAWEWGLKALEYVTNRLPRKNGLSPLEVAGKPPSAYKLWPGDRVAFKPRGPSVEKEDVIAVQKMLVGQFHGFFPGKKAVVSVLTPKDWMAVLVAKEELYPLPISVLDCIKLVVEGFAEPLNLDLATSAAMKEALDPSQAVELTTKPIRTVLAYVARCATPRPETAGKTHLEVTEQELRSGLFDDAIKKEFDSFVRWGVFGPEMTKEEAIQKGFEVVTFRGVASWKLKDGKRVPKWRGVCRGFEDKWQGDVDADTPSFATIRLVFLLCVCLGLLGGYTDGTTAFLQVRCPDGRLVAVVLSGYIPAGLPYRPGGVYPLCKMLYGLKDSPRMWVLFLREHIIALGYKHIGQCVYFRRSPLSIILCFYDDIFCWSKDPKGDLEALGKRVAVDEIAEFKQGSTVRYVGLVVSWQAAGLQFSIAEYCSGLTSAVKESPLSFNRSNVDKLVKTDGDVDKIMLQDLGK